MSVRNKTSHSHQAAALYGPCGRETLAILIKVTRRLSTGEAVSEREPVYLTDVRAPSGAVRVPSDIAPVKRGTDVVCLGHVYAPPESERCEACVALVRVGELSVSAAVSGVRRWERARGGGNQGFRASPPEPFERVPLGWERAFGGAGFPPNPHGLGFVRDVHRAEGMELPQIEAESAKVGSPEDRPDPFCFGAVPAHWPQRRRFAGTYDAAWERTRAPLLPDDLDERFFDAAQLTTRRPLVGGEVIELRHLTPGGELRATVPRVHVRVIIAGREIRPALDRLVLEPDVDRIAMTFRASVDIGGLGARLPSVRIVEKRLAPLGG